MKQYELQRILLTLSAKFSAFCSIKFYFQYCCQYSNIVFNWIKPFIFYKQFDDCR